METERLAVEDLQNQDLSRESDDLTSLKNELTGCNDELMRPKDD
jgi:hypothetical protein